MPYVYGALKLLFVKQASGKFVFANALRIEQRSAEGSVGCSVCQVCSQGESGKEKR